MLPDESRIQRPVQNHAGTRRLFEGRKYKEQSGRLEIYIATASQTPQAGLMAFMPLFYTKNCFRDKI
jgi:hypothetical protein